MVSSGSPSGVYCAVSSWKDGTAKNRRISTGPTVQMTSISVLWLVRDGFGLALCLNRKITNTSKPRTSMTIGTRNQSVYSSNQRISLMMPVAAGCRSVCHGVGWAACAAPAETAEAMETMPASQAGFFSTIVTPNH